MVTGCRWSRSPDPESLKGGGAVRRIEIASVALGACLLVAGTAWVFAPAGVILAGVLLLAFGLDPDKGGA